MKKFLRIKSPFVNKCTNARTHAGPHTTLASSNTHTDTHTHIVTIPSYSRRRGEGLGTEGGNASFDINSYEITIFEFYGY